MVAGSSASSVLDLPTVATLILGRTNPAPKESQMQFHIRDMTCGSCVRHVNEAIAKVDPAAKVEADIAARKITVITTATPQQIEQTLRDDGYPASQV